VAIAASFAFRYHRGLHRLLMLPTDAQAARDKRQPAAQLHRDIIEED